MIYNYISAKVSIRCWKMFRKKFNFPRFYLTSGDADVPREGWWAKVPEVVRELPVCSSKPSSVNDVADRVIIFT